MARRYPTMQDRIIANSVANPRHQYAGVPCRDWTGSIFPTPFEGATREQCYGRISVRFKRGPRKGRVKCEHAAAW